ncbi:probable LRR receptor-like serine/threonine-protein kinase At1g53430 isoform X1 [Amborella trichopoda]|nr:probable LRR receptor-like serine/threonine-protein kinase At1g53430 isoform X1 [Amborella trichopoda]|eukprot:XP_006847778.2 probable LRR receptor-like serine/threonine-protein kinase At1g53430 isoform X1 [Amborella trichopoda]
MALKIMNGILLVLLAFFCWEMLGSEAQSLPRSELNALRQIASKLGMMGNFNVDQCSSGGWKISTTEDREANVTCNCSFVSNTVCHIEMIFWKAQNLSGIIPEDFGNLTHLNVLDFSRNYLNGFIPEVLSGLPLVQLSLLGNRFSGPIPKKFGDMKNLTELVVEANQLGGSLPEELGHLSNLERLILSSNEFTGELPTTFAKLTNLTDFRINGNNISGTIPGFIGNWTKLKKLRISGTSMEGPIPTTISSLEDMEDLRITDLSGKPSPFPPLEKMKKLGKLILRNCSISGVIPPYIEEMKDLKDLDLSFNNLTGGIPPFLKDFKGLDRLYLKSNKLTGDVPDWIMRIDPDVDISNNNFTGATSSTMCPPSGPNMLASYSSVQDKLIRPCLQKGFPCPVKPKNFKLFINCGGRKITIDGEEYEEDLVGKGTNMFDGREKWAVSSTGNFMDNGGTLGDMYVPSSTSNLLAQKNIELYSTARASAISLSYYGLCLQNGGYTVVLYFAEIQFTDGHTFSSLGKRIFDVYIQGKKVLTDFNIRMEANGTGIGINRTFITDVTDHTLEIHFYWAGKGTTSIPWRSFYGPLVSAIRVTPNFTPEIDGDDKFSTGAMVGIVVCSCFVVFLILAVLYMKGYLGGNDKENKELRSLELQTGYFSLKQIKAATKNFDPANKIGEGGFGPVYKGALPDGSVIAIKQLSSKSKQGNREFVNEIGMISALQHPNLVKLYGCCIEGNQLLLIYEYMENNCLSRALFGPDESRLKLDWPIRLKICIGIARGLAYLHEESRLKIVHRDIKGTNVLLDKDLNAKISDFGLAKLDEEENTHISTRIAGTIGYMAPEYAMRGYLTDKADVYSFGIVALEIVSGKSNTNYRPKEECVYLLDWAYVLQEKGSLLELVDPELGSNYSKDEALKMLNVGLLCTNPSPTLRPSMSAVVSMLEGNANVRAPLSRPGATSEEWRFKAFTTISQDSQSQSLSLSLSQSQTLSMEGPTSGYSGPWIASTVSLSSKEEVSSKSHLPQLIDVSGD